MKKLLFVYLSLAVLLFSSVGKIAVTKGEVSVLRGGETLSVSSGFELLEKDTIVTGDGARAQLVFNDETVVSVGKGSEFLVDEYLFEAAADADAQKASFRSLKGAFKTITGKIGKVAPEKFKLATKTATIGIRGTHFLGKINVDGDKIACTHGAISVAAFAGGEPVVVPAGQITSVLAGAIPTPPRKFTVLELNELNEASGVAPSEEEVAPEATTEGEDTAIVVEDEDAEEEVAPVAETLMTKVEESEVVDKLRKEVEKEKEDVTEEEAEKEIKEKTGFDISTGTVELLENVDYDLSLIPDTIEVIQTEGGFDLTQIQNSGPVDMYGKSLTSYISGADCSGLDCSIGTSTSAVNYFYNSSFQLYRDGTHVTLNLDGTGNNLGVGYDVEVMPALSGISQVFDVYVSDPFTDGEAYLGLSDDITGVRMMSSPTGDYEGYNAEYWLETNDPGDTDTWSEDNYITYDNLGEFAIITNETIDPTVDGGMYRDAFYTGVKSSWATLLAGDVPNHLIYKVLMSHSISYDGSGEFSSDFYNGLATGKDYSDSRVIGNTNNGNILYVGRPQNDGRGWGIILGSAGTGSNNEILFNGSLQGWVYGDKDIDGNYFVETDTVIDGLNGAEISGELYGSELQGFGMSIASTTPSVFENVPSTNPTAFDASIVAGYRTDDAGQINLDTPLTGTATMSGFATSKSFVSDSSTGTVYQADVLNGVVDSLVINRDTGDISGTMSMGGTIADGTIASPYATLAVSGTGGQTAAFISDDYFASTLGSIANNYYDLAAPVPVNGAGGIMATNPGFALDDVTWGYWTAAYTDGTYDLTYHHKSTWVAGIDTAASKIADIVSAAGGAAGVEVYTFEGKILGRIHGNGPSGTINTDTSWVRVAVDFGSSTPVSGNMIFTAVDYPEVVWYVNIDATGSTLNTTSGYMNAALSGNANSIVTIGSGAGELHADLYGTDATAIGGEFQVLGTLDNTNDLAAIGVFKGATDQTLTAPVVGDQKILVGHQVSTWIDNPTGTDDNWREATLVSGSSGGYMDSSAFYIAVDGDTGTYRSFGDLSYSGTYDGTQFVPNTPEYEDPDSGSLTIGTVTAQTETTMTTAVGGYSSVSAEDLSDSTTDRFVVYDNLKDFFIVLESSNNNEYGEAYRSLVYAGTPYAGMSGETDNLIGYNLVAAVDRTTSATEVSSGAGSPLLDGSGIIAPVGSMVINRNTGMAVFVGKPGSDDVGTYLDGWFGTFNETTGIVSGNTLSVNSGGTGGADASIESFEAGIMGSANQGVGVGVYGNYNSVTYQYEDVTAIAGVRVDTPDGVSINPATDTDGSTGTVTWAGSVAGIRSAAAGDPFEHGTITGLSINKTTGEVAPGGYLTLGTVSGGVVTANEYIDIGSTSTYNAAYVSDDYIAMGFDQASYNSNLFTSGIDGGGVMVTSPDGVEDDYASWGYWGASFGDPATTGFEFSGYSTWVAGELADITTLASPGTSMDFTGHVLGVVTTVENSVKVHNAIDMAGSLVDLHVDFGTTDPISGTITFNPTNDTAMVWKMDVGTNTITYTNSSFDASLAKNAGSAVDITSAEMHGNFFGNGTAGSVSSMGGSIAAGGLYNSSYVGAEGVIKATKD